MFFCGLDALLSVDGLSPEGELPLLVHGHVTIIFVVSVGLSVCLSACLSVCAEFFSAIFDPISIKLGHTLYIGV